MYFSRIQRTVSDKGILISTDQIDDQIKKLIEEEPDKDYYISYFKYTKDALDFFNKNHSIKGYNGKVYSNTLIFDFDNSGDLNLAKEEVRQLLTKLKDLKIDVIKSCSVFFSGGKGFHVYVKLDKDLEHEVVANICKNLAKELSLKTFDTSIYNTQRIIRAPFTKHNKTGLYKIAIKPVELKDLSIEQILEKAKVPNQQEYSELKIPANSDIFNDYFVEKKEAKSVVVQSEIDSSIIRGLRHINFDNMPKGTPRCIYALQQGIMVPNEIDPAFEGRSRIFFRLATWFRNQGFDKVVTHRMLKGIAELNKKLYPEVTPISKDEIWEQHINSAYNAESIKYQKAGSPGANAENDILMHYCEAVGEFTNKSCCLHKKRLTKEIYNTDDMYSDFKSYASKLEKNTIKTGINFIDDNMTISRGEVTLLVGSMGCHRKGEGILMHDGSIKNAEDIQLGDFLMGPDSQPRTVLELKRGQDEMYKITPIKGEAFYVNGNHILYYGEGKNKTYEIPVKDYHKKHKIKREGHVLLRSEVDFIKKDVEIDPYILGVWLGDGYADSPRFITMDAEIREELHNYASVIGSNFKKTHNNSGKAYCYALTGNVAIFMQKLKKYNLQNNKHIPKDYLINSREVRLQLLAGLLDTDGSLSKKCFDFIQKRKELAEQVLFLARSLGFGAYLTTCKKKSQHGTEGTYYRICISGNTDLIPTKVKRKQAGIRLITKDTLHVGFTIEKVADKEDYYGFLLDKDHLYLDDSFNILHNCGKTTFTLNLVENAVNYGIPVVFFSLDMHKNQLFLKLASKCTNYSTEQVKYFCKTNENNIGEQIKQQVANVYKNVFFLFNATMMIEEMRDKVLELNQQHGVEIGLVIVDYAGRISGPYSDAMANARYNALKSKEMADVTNSNWFILCQISRQKGDGSIPLRTARAARDSGEWEEAASNVLTMWRPFLGQGEKDNVLKIYLAKNRMGPSVEGVVHWDGARSTIANMTDEEYMWYEEERGKEEEEAYKSRMRGPGNR